MTILTRKGHHQQNVGAQQAKFSVNGLYTKFSLYRLVRLKSVGLRIFQLLLASLLYGESIHTQDNHIEECI